MPVALVVNGAPVASPIAIGPPSLPTVANSNARPPLRLFARTHGSLPGVGAAAVDRAAAVAVLLVGLARAVGRVVGDDLRSRR